MNAEKRKVTTDALETLGNIIEGGGRDAIHLAVEPVIAGMGLMPGQDIGIRNGEAFKYMANEKTPVKLVGIVDPFLKEPVLKGQMFWLIVYPRQITSLRHVWEHPDFKDNKIELHPTSKELSEKWLREFCKTNDCPSYERVIAAIVDGEYYESLHFDGMDAHGEIPAEFWNHVEEILGYKISNRPEFFSCSC